MKNYFFIGTIVTNLSFLQLTSPLFITKKNKNKYYKNSIRGRIREGEGVRGALETYIDSILGDLQ